MKSIKVLIVAVVCSIPLFAGDYVVIVGKSSALTAISAADLKRIYTGKKSDFNGVKAVPVAYDLANPASVQFLSEMLGMTVGEYREFWMAQQVKGLGSAPAVQKNPDGLISAVADAPGGIGFIDKTKVTDAVKTIPVN